MSLTIKALTDNGFEFPDLFIVEEIDGDDTMNSHQVSDSACLRGDYNERDWFSKFPISYIGVRKGALLIEVNCE